MNIYAPPPQLLYRLSGHGFWVEGVAWSPDGKMLASGSSDDSVRIWDIASKQTTKQLTFQGSAEIVAWSPNGKYLATISAEHGDTLKIWDTSSWNMVAHMDPGKGADSPTDQGGMAWSPNSKYLVVSANGFPNDDVGRVRVYDTSTWQVAMEADAPFGVGEEAWSPDGVSIAFSTNTELGGGDAVIEIWNIQTNEITKLTDPEQKQYDSIAWSPNGQYIAAAWAGDNDAAIWDLSADQKIQTLKGHTFPIESIAWSPDSNKLASGSTDSTVIIWDVITGKTLENFKHEDGVFDVAWSPDGKTLAAACADGLVYLWAAK